MCMQPAAWPEPDPQIAAAIAVMYGTRKTARPLAVLIRDRLGEWLRDEVFAAAFGDRGRPGWSPSRLDWKYLLGLPADDPGFDHTVLAEFRGRVADSGLEQVVLDALLSKLAAGGLVKAGGRQRTDSTHVIAAVAALNRLELAGESVRAVLEALTAAHPARVAQRICVPGFARRGIRMSVTTTSGWCSATAASSELASPTAASTSYPRSSSSRTRPSRRSAESSAITTRMPAIVPRPAAAGVTWASGTGAEQKTAAGPGRLRGAGEAPR